MSQVHPQGLEQEDVLLQSGTASLYLSPWSLIYSSNSPCSVTHAAHLSEGPVMNSLGVDANYTKTSSEQTQVTSPLLEAFFQRLGFIYD